MVYLALLLLTYFIIEFRFINESAGITARVALSLELKDLVLFNY